MKICIISNLYKPYIIGGAEINVERLARALSKSNNVFVITTIPFSGLSSLLPKQEVQDGVKVYRFYPLNLYNVYFTHKRKISPFLKVIWHILDLWNIHTFLMVLRILKKEKPDIIHTGNLDGLSYSVLWSAKFLGLSLVHNLNDYHLVCPYANLICPYTKFKICSKRPFPCKIFSFLKKIVVDSIPKLVIGPSRSVTNIHKRYKFFEKINYEVIPNFIDIENSHMSLNKKHNFTLDILYVGRLSPEKGVSVLIRTFRDLKENFLRLHIVGEGREKQHLENLGRDDSRIKFYGKIMHKEINKFYTIADILVIPSLCYEVFGIVIIEAFVFGVPAIGTNISGIAEIIKNEYNGFLFEPFNTLQLKEIFKRLINDFKSDRYLLKRLSENAFSSSSSYREEGLLALREDLYNKIIHNEE